MSLITDVALSEAERHNVDVYIWYDSSGAPILKEWYAPDGSRTVKTAPNDNTAKKRFWFSDTSREIDNTKTKVFWTPRNFGDNYFGTVG